MSNSATPWTIARQLLYPWSLPSKDTDCTNPRTEPESPVSPALAGRFFTTEPPGSPNMPIVFLEFISQKSKFMFTQGSVHNSM